MSSQNAITVCNLTKKYGSFIAVNNISFEVKKNEIFGLLGPNGAGKTTTIEILETLCKKTAGEVKIDSFDLDQDTSKIKSLIGVQLQSNEFYKSLNLKEIIKLFAGLYGVYNIEPLELLERVQLNNVGHKKFKQLSGGQQQRFSLAVTLINSPSIIFLDEPTTGLDPQSRHVLWNIIREMHKDGMTIVLTTHYMDEAEMLCDRVGIMEKGEIITIDTPQKLIDNLLATGFSKKIEVKKANLEDVFLHLTGHQLRES